MRPTSLSAGIDKDRPDYTVYCGGSDKTAAPRVVLSHVAVALRGYRLGSNIART